MGTVVMAGNNVGGLVNGAYGTYTQAADGTFTVDTRDGPTFLTLGMTYINRRTAFYTTPKAPAAATVSQIVASAVLSNGALAIANQPDVPRPAQVVLGAGTLALTAGSVVIGYTANDGTLTTDTLSAVVSANATTTQLTSKGVVKIATAFVTNSAGGASPFIHVDTIGAISVPVDQNTVDFSVYAEYLNGTIETTGALISSLGSITPTTAPNGTNSYSFQYTAVVGDQ
jgi:hypothetical protein